MSKERERMQRWPQLVNLRFWHSSVKDFTMSPWFNPMVLCIYRGIAALYLMSWWLYNISANMQKGKLFIYFTNLSLTVIAFYYAIGMNLSCIRIMQRRDKRHDNEEENFEGQPLATLRDKWTIDQSDDYKVYVDNNVTISENITTEEETPTRPECSDAPKPSLTSPTISMKQNCLKDTRKFKSSIEEEDDDSVNSFTGTSKLSSGKDVCYQVYWLLHNISTNISILLAIGYCNNVFEDQTFFANVITKELVGMALIVVETLIGGIPVRMCHVVYPMLFTISYIIFTAIYWASGGTDAEGRGYIYRLLDYENMNLSTGVILILIVFVVQPLIHLAFYIVFVTRRCLANRLCRCR